MEEKESKNGEASTEFLAATVDGMGPRMNPVDVNDGLNAVHRDASNNKHSYWRGRGAQGRSPESSDALNKIMDPSRTVIDTTAPFESVKDAVSMFGGNVEWKEQSVLVKEGSRNLEQELQKAGQEVPLYRKQLEDAEDANARVLRELKITRKQVEELRLQVQKAMTEEAQARQDSELAQLRLKEIEQGIVNEHSVAARAQVKVARTRYLEADAELKSVQLELEALKKECCQLMKERDIATEKSEEAVMASIDVEEMVEELVMEQVIAEEALESAQESHLKEKEPWLKEAMEREEDSFIWEQMLKQSQEDLNSFEEKLVVMNDLKLNFNTASALLASLKSELAAYVETEIGREDKREFVHANILAAAKEELEEERASVEKAKDEVNCLRIAASSLKSELDAENSRLSLLKQKQKISDLTISSLETELEKNQPEQDELQVNAKHSHEEMRDLPHELQEKSDEIHEAKSKVHSARQELTKAMEEAELAKAGANTMELGLKAVFKETEAAKASEKLALEAIKAIQENEEATECSQEISIPSEEYYALSKRASGAERLSNKRVVAAVLQIKDAKRTEQMCRQKLEAAYKEIKERKEALRDASEKAEKATEGKMKMEQELREWRAENEQRRKAGEAIASSKGLPDGMRSYWKSFDDSRNINGTNAAAVGLHINSTPNRHYAASEGDAHVPALTPNRNISFFPRIVMFLARKKAESLK